MSHLPCNACATDLLLVALDGQQRHVHGSTGRYNASECSGDISGPIDVDHGVSAVPVWSTQDSEVAGAGAEHEAPAQGGPVAGAAQPIRVQRVHETGMWLASADVTGQRNESRIGLGPTCLIAPAGYVVDQVPLETVGIAIAEINQP